MVFASSGKGKNAARRLTVTAAALAAAVGAAVSAHGAAAAGAYTPAPNVAPAPIAAPAPAQLAQNAVAGMRTFIRCRACHTIAEGDVHRVGPNLFGIIGRAAGTAEGFELYSDAMKNSGIVWDDATLTEYLTNPMERVPDNLMNFPGVAPEAIADLLAYIRRESGAN